MSAPRTKAVRVFPILTLRRPPLNNAREQPARRASEQLSRGGTYIHVHTVVNSYPLPDYAAGHASCADYKDYGARASAGGFAPPSGFKTDLALVPVADHFASH